MRVRTVIIIFLLIFTAAAELTAGGFILGYTQMKLITSAESQLYNAESTDNDSKKNSIPDAAAVPPDLPPGGVGWIKIDDTLIDYPVMQAEDNEFYLTHSPDGERDVCGAVFLDCQAENDSHNKVIYGHNMGRNRTEMFSELVYFEDEQYAGEHSLMRFTQPDGIQTEYILFAVMNFNINRLSEFDYMKREIPPEEFDGWAEYIRKNSIFTSGELHSSDRLITLSTCSRKYGENNRLILFFKEKL